MSSSLAFFMVCCCLLFPTSRSYSALGEKLRFERLSSKNGLTQSSVLTLCQDHKGFLWIGTYDGAARYDGIHFRSFKHSAADSTSLSQNLVRHIFEDHTGVLWFGTENGLSRFDRVKETFTNFFADAKNPNSISNNHIRRIYEDRSGTLWIATEDGLNKYDREHGSFVQYRSIPGNPHSLANGFIRTVVEGIEGTFWVGTSLGLDVMDRGTGTFTHMQNDPEDPHSLSENVVVSLLEDRSGSLWVGTQHGGLNRLDRGSKRFVRYRFDLSDPTSIRSDYVTQIMQDRSGEIWIATYGGGLEKYDHATDSFVHFQNIPSDPTSISSNMCYCLFEDRSSIIYVGTDFGGISTLDRRKNRFSWHAHDPSDSWSLNNDNVNAVYEDPADGGSTLWIGTAGGGLSRFDRQSETFSSYKHNPENSTSLSDDVVRCIAKDHKGYLWVGTNNGLNRFDQTTRRFVRYLYDPRDPQSLRNNTIMSICEDKTQTLWIGTNRGGLEQFDRERNQFIHYRKEPGNPNGLNDNQIWCIHEDPLGILWIGTNDGGLNRFDPVVRTFTHYMTDVADSTSISDNKVLCLCEDRDGVLWIGTAGGGLNRFVPAEGRFTRYSEEDGLVSNTVHSIVEDQQGDLWISGPRGISRFEPRKGTFTSFDARDGLQNTEFHVNAACLSLTGELFLGGINGLTSFFPGRLDPNIITPPVVITEFQLFNRPIFPGKEIDGRILIDSSISETHTLRLSYLDEVFSIEFAALDFACPDRNQYAYRMDGFDKEWNYTGDRHFATYTRLPPGQYVFRAKGSNNSGRWNDTGAELLIIIGPPFWLTWWFIALAVVLVLSSLVLAYQARTRRMRRRTRELERRVQDRTSQLKTANDELEAFTYSVSHDLRAPLRAIDGFCQILFEDHHKSLDNEGQKVIEVIRNETRRMAQLIDDLLRFSRLGKVEMHYSSIDMTALASLVFDEITTPEQRERIDFAIGRMPDAVGDPALVRQVWSNLLSNAVKFSSKKPRSAIRIDGCETSEEYTYTIKDNGAGFQIEYADKLFGVFQRLHGPSEFEGTGVGLAIVRRLIEGHGGRVWANGVVNEGASFSFSLPKSLRNHG
jgi:ligand-binding sensor domain-containing protein/signal transduction histidine kinase